MLLAKRSAGLFYFCLIAVICVTCVNACTRAPTHLPHGRRTRGDNGYRLIVADGPNGYVPGKTYNSKYVHVYDCFMFMMKMEMYVPPHTHNRDRLCGS